MKTITKFLLALFPAILLSASVAHAQCTSGYSWSQTSNNVITFTNTSSPIIPNSTFFTWDFGDMQYDWQQDPVHTYNVPGTYIACVTMYDSLSQTCSSTFCDTITVTGTVICNMTVNAYLYSAASCSTCSDGAAYAYVSGGTAPYTYAWSNSATTQIANQLAAGNYTVCVTDANGCNACDTIYVPVNSCTAGFTWTQTSNNVIAFTNTSSPIIPNSTSFTWYFGDQQYDWQQDPVHTYSIPGTYLVCVTMYDSLTQSCSSTFCDSVTVFGNVLCNVSVSAFVSSPATCSTCADGIANANMYNGTGPYTYSWSDGQTTQTATGLAPGNYSVCITDANGCSACDSINIPYQNTNCNASFTWSQSQNNIIDFVNTSVNSNNGYTMYYWDFGDGNYYYSFNANNISNNYLNPGTYMVCLNFYDSLSGCQSSYCDSVTVYGNPSSAACNANFVIYPDSINTNVAWIYNLSTGSPYMTYQWFWGDNTPIDTVAYPSHVYNATGSYIICLVVVDPVNQCSDTMCQLLWVPRLSQQAASNPFYVNVVPTGIHEQSQVSWSLFPNPATTELTIKTDYNLQGSKFRILDIAGRVVITNAIDGNKIDVNSLDKGMYFLQIENGQGGFSAQRFIKN